MYDIIISHVRSVNGPFGSVNLLEPWVCSPVVLTVILGQVSWHVATVRVYQFASSWQYEQSVTPESVRIPFSVTSQWHFLSFYQRITWHTFEGGDKGDILISKLELFLNCKSVYIKAIIGINLSDNVHSFSTHWRNIPLIADWKQLLILYFSKSRVEKLSLIKNRLRRSKALLCGN